MELFDTHAHYNDEKFNDDRDSLIIDIYNEGITKLVCVGYNVEQSKYALELAKKYDFIYASCGISPNDIYDYSDEKLKEIEELGKEDKIVAIGEIGLDYYWEKDNKEKQKELFIKQIDIANRLNKPIIIHNRDAYVDTIQILKDHPVNKTGIFHCCPLNQELIKDGLKLGFYISFSGTVTFKNAKSEDPVKLVPMDKLLIETDSPYLSPEPNRGKRNDSRNVKYVAQRIAEIKGISVEEVAKCTYENAKKVYLIK